MKKFYSILAALVVSVSAMAQVTVEDAAVKAGDQVQVNINITGATAYNAAGMLVNLPEGFSFVEDEEEEAYTLGGDVFAKNHGISEKLQKPTVLKFAVLDTKKNAAFKVDEGVLATVTIKADASVANGAYEASVTTIELSKADKSGQVVAPDVKFNIAVCDDPTGISNVKSASTISAVYNAAGAKQNGLQKGINIVKMADGSVKKIAK